MHNWKKEKKMLLQKLNNNKLKHHNHAIKQIFNFKSNKKSKLCMIKKYYCRKLNNNKLKNDNHAINPIFNFKS